MTAVLVTGGAGFVGSHACKALAQAGYFPVAYDNLSRGNAWAVKWGPLERGDIADKGRLKAVMVRYRPAAVLHFAAFAYARESVEAPGLYYRNNVAGTLGLLEAMRETAIGAMVVSSSCAVYGVPAGVPICEAHPIQPINPYGASKAMMERMLADCSTAHGLRYVALRYFNAAGADPAREIGEAHLPETHLIPMALSVAAGCDPHVDILGSDYDTPDGTCIRDYVHVSDLADAHVLALKRLLSGSCGTSYNLGSGVGYSVREVIDTACDVTGRTIKVCMAPRRVGDAPVLVADPSNAIRDLGWNPKRSSLAVQIGDAWRWHQSQVGAPMATACE
jgi:UDP-arabinose 4-epimerase